MGAAQTSVAQRELMLRRIALVLSSLPAPMASRILDEVDPQSRNLIHQAVATLSHVPVAERSEALKSFADDMRASQPSRLSRSTLDRTVVDTSGVQDEIVLGDSTSPGGIPATPFVSPPGSALTSQSTTSDQAAHFAFLRDAKQDDLVKLLSGERPQTIALVLASIAPKQAADVLPHLNADLQSQTLNRIGRLEEVADAAVVAVANHMRSRYDDLTSIPSSSGSEALKAIISELPQFAAATSPGNASLKIAEGTWPAEQTQSAASETQDDFQPTQFQPNPAELQATDTLPLQREPRGESQKPVAEDSTQAIHRFLVDLSPQTLVESLGRVGTREALLTLCGLPNATAEAAIAVLPRAKAKAARHGMTQLGSLRLSEIDDAKQEVARAAKDNAPLRSRRAA